MTSRLAALIVDESKWLPASMGLAFLIVVLLLHRHRRSSVSRRHRTMAAMSLFFGVTMAAMASGHILAVTTKLAMGTLVGSPFLLYAIGVALAVPSAWLVHHALGQFGSDAERGKTTLALNAWLALTLLALGIHNIPLALPGLLNVGYQLHTGRVSGRAIVSLAAAANVALFVGSLMFLASGQTFEEFTGIGTARLAPSQPVSASNEERMEDTQIAALVEMMRAVNAGDAAAYARLYSPDAVITIHGTGVLKGRQAIEAHETELMREFPGARLAFYTVWQKGPAAVVHYGVNGRTTSGHAMGHEGLLFYQFQPSGLIEEERRYLDSITPMAQLGLLGPSPVRPLPTLPDQLRSFTATGSSREQVNVAMVTATLEAQDAGNETAFLSSMAEDAVLDELMEPAPLVGRSKLQGWFGRWTGAFSGARTEITSISGVGDFVLAETLVHGTLTGGLGRVTASNTAITLHRALIVQIGDGRVSRITAFMNGKELAQATGQWPLAAGRPAPRP